MGVSLTATVVVDNDLKEICFVCQICVTASRSEDGVERIDVFNMEAHLQIGFDRLNRSADFGQNLVFPKIEQAIPGQNLRVFHEQPPKLDEIAIGRTLTKEGLLDEVIQA